MGYVSAGDEACENEVEVEVKNNVSRCSRFPFYVSDRSELIVV